MPILSVAAARTAFEFNPLNLIYESLAIKCRASLEPSRFNFSRFRSTERGDKKNAREQSMYHKHRLFERLNSYSHFR